MSIDSNPPNNPDQILEIITGILNDLEAGKSEIIKSYITNLEVSRLSDPNYEVYGIKSLNPEVPRAFIENASELEIRNLLNILVKQRAIFILTEILEGVTYSPTYVTDIYAGRVIKKILLDKLKLLGISLEELSQPSGKYIADFLDIKAYDEEIE